jgi:hypothetical protein
VSVRPPISARPKPVMLRRDGSGVAGVGVIQ